jgi:hypothetical protein
MQAQNLVLKNKKGSQEIMDALDDFNNGAPVPPPLLGLLPGGTNRFPGGFISRRGSVLSRRTITLHWVAELIVFSTFNAALREYVKAPKKRLKDEIGERSDLGSMEKSGTSRDAIPSEPVVR